MPNPWDDTLRRRAVHAYEAGEAAYEDLAALFAVGVRTLQRWVQEYRAEGALTPKPKGGGWRSPILMPTLHALIAEAPDATCAELCCEYNRRVSPAHHTTPSVCGGRCGAVRRAGYVVKKRPRPSEIDRADIQQKRAAYRRWRRTVDAGRLIFVDEAGANLAMGRSHAWVQKGTEYVEPRPMNWGTNLTLIGAMDRQGWVTLGTQWAVATADSFVAWVRDRLAPQLCEGDIVVLDNLRAHKDPRVRWIIQSRGARVHFLPPYSYDYNPIESAWALLKKRIRAFAPRTVTALRRVARAARHVV